MIKLHARKTVKQGFSMFYTQIKHGFFANQSGCRFLLGYTSVLKGTQEYTKVYNLYKGVYRAICWGYAEGIKEVGLSRYNIRYIYEVPTQATHQIKHLAEKERGSQRSERMVGQRSDSWRVTTM